MEGVEGFEQVVEGRWEDGRGYAREGTLLTIRFVSATKRFGCSGIAKEFFELGFGQALRRGFVGDAVAEVEEFAGG